MKEAVSRSPPLITDVCRIYGVQNRILLYGGQQFTFLLLVLFIVWRFCFNCYAPKSSAIKIMVMKIIVGVRVIPLISKQLASPPMVAKIAQIKSPRVIKIFVIKHTQLCYTACAEATSFLRSSCGHPQVQTVPSSAWDAPCPVVTPSLKGLGSAFSVFELNMD